MAIPEWVKSLPFDRDVAIFTVDGHKYIGRVKVRQDAIILDVKRTTASEEGEAVEDPWSVIVPTSAVASVHYHRTASVLERQAAGEPAES